MKWRVVLVVLVLLALGGTWSRAKSVGVQGSNSVRWEYCSVGLGGTSSADKSRSTSQVSYFSADPVLRTDRVEGKNPYESFRHAIARLGADGWEMIGVVGDVPVAYFKRPLH